MGILNLLTGGITSLAGQYMDNKKAIGAAKHERKLNKINQTGDWETSSISQMASSMKDEWWTFWLSLPLIAIFTSPFIDLIMLGEYTQGCLQIAALKGLAGLESAPTWFTYLIGISISASFGIRGVGGIVNKLRKGK
ncbi:MAG: hypothetical protein GY810_02240 [Aureispira sp.]|nr:hypothetical protein [Aureispira sp.]